MKYIPQGPEDQASLLKAIGLSTAEDLFENIPSNLRLRAPLEYPLAQSEAELRQTFKELSSLSPSSPLSFAGCGVYTHDIPSIVPFIQGRSEFSTSYTPYQPEISQGTLQAIFEYQTLACQMTECELSNASLYDGATSLAEGILMALRIQKKRAGKILITSALHPYYRGVIDTYCEHFKDRLVEIPMKDDQLDLAQLKSQIASADIVVTQSPNIFGVIEDHAAIGDLIKSSEALWVTSTMEPLSFGVLKGPGAFGAHIVTAEGQSFGNAPYLGGSTYGIFCTRSEYIRQLPGRLVGETVDQKGRRSYTLTFATREQFIRREKSTSNICTNNNLNMLAGLFHLTALGKEGIRELAIQNLSIAEFLKKRIRTETKTKISSSPTFNEFVVEVSDAAALVSRAADAGWICGVNLGRFKSEWKHKLLIHVNELHRLEQIEKLVQLLKSSI